MSYDQAYDAPPPPYSSTPHHQVNNPYYNRESFSTDNHDNLDEKHPQIDSANAETLAEAQQHSSSTKESDRNEQAALDESLSWIDNANRQPHAGIHAPLAVSKKTPTFATSNPHTQSSSQS